MLTREGSNRVDPEIGIPDPQHPLTHHINNKEWIEKVTQINTHHIELHAGFLAKLKATPDGEKIEDRRKGGQDHLILSPFLLHCGNFRSPYTFRVGVEGIRNRPVRTRGEAQNDIDENRSARW